MAGRMDGKISFITGAGRGQGRAHAVLQAREGADIIAVDICEDIESNPYPMASWDDLIETQRMVEKEGRRCVAVKADVRNRDQLADAVSQGLAEFGRVTTVMANAGILPMAMGDPEPLDFQDAVDVDLIGVMNTVAVTVPHLVAAGTGASIIITGSTAALIPNTANDVNDPRRIMGPGGAGYSWSKQTLVGYAQQMALHLAPTGIRINVVHPTNCNTHLMNAQGIYQLFRPDLQGEVSKEDFQPASEFYHALPTSWLEPEDVAELVLFLASDASKHMTGTSIPIDAGCMIKWPNGPGQ
ncbi:3-ketoacyl-ACP reductase [Mycolicibacterium elephantis]|uniref:mycofactocin-coupled SDR family oxidoreductase n=1 Tax=Mycolicibacterium elephantis TaxID=81858 RepID=UPI0006292E28|nr:mycofactocin-coupled SDR family oxidoreductase [Mycolicibacterium elephantis]KKW66462.1 3-ketoacyl-ACP reductase [Mycolicibacterium elephantis]OBE97453.1 3-ketoacyl-ACP reductase [Mycolicibacterium elephantis]